MLRGTKPVSNVPRWSILRSPIRWSTTNLKFGYPISSSSDTLLGPMLWPGWWPYNQNRASLNSFLIRSFQISISRIQRKSASPYPLRKMKKRWSMRLLPNPSLKAMLGER
ncbi:hypothetical protein RHSIM_RhsimUnG0191500 [Rhododendron simsii]|uniref:Uncharacterized protein n=1 Tax=Rhododendron simsii TaxID=118357 RepID=A0A834FUX7_RHOSS|nr:hypothetical protein RHSIM_RhsimUnG0191500 [Rhododendron simsii]